MVDRFLFKDRDGRTPLTPDFKKDLTSTHPFSNGNGRTSRILAEAICKFEKNQVPTWGRSLKVDAKTHRNTYLAAVMKARHQRDFADLIQFMFE